jgi:hypothetical protein
MRIVTTVAVAAAVAVTLGATAARAGGAVTAALTIDYFKVAHGVDADFSGATPTVLDGSKLGTNGLPIASGVADLGGGDSELLWWTPSLNHNVVADGTGTVDLPFDVSMYAPHGTGNNDGTFFETAVLSGDFSLSTPSTISFNLGSDDDSFIYIDGTLIGQNPGIHGVTFVNFDSGTLGAGNHTVEIFYADRESTGAVLSVALNSTGITITPGGAPEPAAWALMLVGFGSLGAALRRRRPGAAAA